MLKAEQKKEVLNVVKYADIICYLKSMYQMVQKITYSTGCNDLTSKDYRHSIITEKQKR